MRDISRRKEKLEEGCAHIGMMGDVGKLPSACSLGPVLGTHICPMTLGSRADTAVLSV